MVKKKMGRPTKYRPQYAEQILEFFSLDEPSYREVETSWGIQFVARRVPTLQRFALMIGVNTSTLWTWANAKKANTDEFLYPDFSNAYTRAKNCQAAIIIEAGIVGALNTSFAIIMLRNIHQWRNKEMKKALHPVSIDMKAVDADLKAAALEQKRKYELMIESGEVGKFKTGGKNSG